MPGRPKHTPSTAIRTAHNSRDIALLERNLILKALIAYTGWPAHLEPMARPQLLFPMALCVHTPLGQLAWWLTDHDLSLFSDLPVAPQSHYDGAPHDEKLRRLVALGQSGKPPTEPSGPLAHLIQRFNAPTVARIEHEAAIVLGGKLPGRYYLYVRDNGRGVDLDRVTGKRKPFPPAGWFYAATLEKQ